jgi:hypothetical protein
MASGPASNQQDVRQLKIYVALQQLLPNLTYQQFSTLLNSIDLDLTVPLRVDAQATPTRVVNVGAAVISNTVSSRSRSISFINNEIPNTFAGGTVTFPSVSGGNITTSTGDTVLLTMPNNNYCQVLISLDAFGDILVNVGGASPTLAGATVPAPITNTLPIAYVTLHTTGASVDVVTQAMIYQLLGGGGSGSGGSTTGFAQEVVLALGATSVAVTFPSSLAGSGYIVNAQMINTTDALPEFQPVTITAKTANGFTATWNNPTDTAHYKLDYLVPSVQSQVGEATLGLGVTSVTVTLPIAMATTSYVVTANLVDLTDANPQFQPVTITAKTLTSFTATWNNITDTANYKVAYNVASFQ